LFVLLLSLDLRNEKNMMKKWEEIQVKIMTKIRLI